MIVEREKVISAFVRRRETAATVEQACADVAQEFGLAPEAVQGAVADAEALDSEELA